MNNNIMKTFIENNKSVKRKWYVVDATDLILGRMSSIVASILRGKTKPSYTSNVDCGDYVIIINADKIALTGHKDLERKYWYTGYMGGAKYRTKGELREKNPEKLIRGSIKQMIPRGPLGRVVIKKLYVYAGAEHPHNAQNPEVLDIKSMNNKNSKRR